MKFPGPVMQVMETLQEAGHACYAVGGCVRDKLLGRTPKDYDLATSATPDQVEALFAHTIPTGKKHGTITVIEDGEQIEVTTFRREGTYKDHRHPDSIEFVQDIETDLARRDFTINAMAWSEKTGVVDPFGGQKDLLDKVIKTVGNPDDRFKEDALRMVRAHRFAARYKFRIDEETGAAIKRNEHLMKDVAVERLVPEWMEILEKNPRQIAQMTGLFKPWIPELADCARTPQQSPYHYTGVLNHILDSIRYLKPFDPTLALVLLLHDLGKPSTHTNENGRDHFYKHPRVGKAIAQRIVQDLKLSNEQKKLIPELVLHHDDILPPSLKGIYKFRTTYGWSDAMVQALYKVQYCDIMAHSLLGQKRLERWKESQDFYNANKNNRPLSFKDLDIKGDDLIRHAGLQGKEIGRALEAVLERCFYHPEKNTRLSILTYVLKNRNRFKEKL